MKKVAVASDHAGFELKARVIEELKSRGYEVEDFGTHSDASCDYPDYAHPAAQAIEDGKCDFGVAMCGTGNGIAMTFNKHQGIRAALCWTPEIASLARQHNNANVLVMPARFISKETAMEILHTYLDTEFEGGRHQRRIDKISVQ